MVIDAKFSTICPTCNVRIQVRESVEWTKGSPARHVTCANGREAELQQADRAWVVSGASPMMAAALGYDTDDRSYDAWLQFKSERRMTGAQFAQTIKTKDYTKATVAQGSQDDNVQAWLARKGFTK